MITDNANEGTVELYIGEDGTQPSERSKIREKFAR